MDAQQASIDMKSEMGCARIRVENPCNKRLARVTGLG